jgi:hypothetical protein
MKGFFYSVIPVNKFGWPEMFLALYPIIMGYGYGIINMSIIGLIGLDIIFFSFRKKTTTKRNLFRTVIFLLVFVVFHEIFLFFILDVVPSYFYSNIFSYIVFLVSIPIIAPRVNYAKYESSINIVCIICIIGLIYHVVLITLGGSVSPIKLPFMPTLEKGARLFSVVQRPTSFFWEPQSFVSFCMIPLCMALLKKKFIWSAIIIFSILLSTSTTGIVFTFVVLALFVFSQKFSKKLVLLMFVSFALIVFLLTSTPIFQAGMEKLSKTTFDFNGDIRLVNGPIIFNSLSLEEIVCGIPIATINDYVEKKGVDVYYLEQSGNLYVASFWLILIKFGIVGAFLYLKMHIESIFKCKRIIIYVVPLILALFSNPDSIGGLFTFEFIFIYSYILYLKKFGTQ